MTVTPEERRDMAVADIIAAGGTVLGTEPLATPDDPHTVAAYRVRAGASTPAILDALADVQISTEVDMSGLIPWTPEPPEEVIPDASTGI